MQNEQNKHYEAVKRCKEKKQIKAVGFDATPEEREVVEELQNITGLGRKAAILTACRAYIAAYKSEQE